jgi:S1-C subfamily serine protease
MKQFSKSSMNRFALFCVFCLVTNASFSADSLETRALAEQGNAQAQFNLGVMYEFGRSAPQSYVEAAKWFRKAAEQGHPVAQSNLGEMYAEGWGVPQNYAEAYVWSSIAAASNYEVATYFREKYAQLLSHETLDAAQKRVVMLYDAIQQGKADTAGSQAPFSGTRTESVTKSSGTCFFVDGIGTAVTNHHVVYGSSNIEVITSDGSKSSAKLIKASDSLDTAVLSTGHMTPNYLSLAKDKSLSLGQDVFTIGYPVTSILGSAPKYSEGTVSALSGLRDDESWIQMSTPIQPGNSGGPLVNDEGQVVGIVTATAAVENFFSVTGSLPQNVNWAIKAEYARPLISSASDSMRFNDKQAAISHTQKSICRVIVR